MAGLPAELTPVFTAGGGAESVQHRRAVVPASPYTAAWGDPPVVLLCGVRSDDPSNGLQPLCSADGRVATWYRDVFTTTQWNTRVRPDLQVTIPDGNATQVTGPLSSITDALPDSVTRVPVPTDDVTC